MRRRWPAGAVCGLGVDLCAIPRMERALAGAEPGILAAMFTPAEIRRCRDDRQPAAAFAVSFAAKEAVLKALAGCGGQGTFWHDIEIRREAAGPRAVLRGRLAELAAAHGIRRVQLALGRCRRYATATALAVASGSGPPGPP